MKNQGTSCIRQLVESKLTMGNGQVNRKKKAKKEEKSFRRDFYRQAFRKRKRIRILGPPDASRIEFTVTAVAEKKKKKNKQGTCLTSTNLPYCSIPLRKRLGKHHRVPSIAVSIIRSYQPKVGDCAVILFLRLAARACFFFRVGFISYISLPSSPAGHSTSLKHKS